MRAARLALAAGLAACAALAAAQQPAPQQKAAPQKAAPQKPTPQQQLERMQQSKASYDTYEASRTFPGRRSGCSKGEDPLGAFCVKACKKGYVEIDDRKASKRQCRSAKPLPPGVTPTKGQKEKSAVVIRAQKDSDKPSLP